MYTGIAVAFVATILFFLAAPAFVVLVAVALVPPAYRSTPRRLFVVPPSGHPCRLDRSLVGPALDVSGFASSSFSSSWSFSDGPRAEGRSSNYNSVVEKKQMKKWAPLQLQHRDNLSMASVRRTMRSMDPPCLPFAISTVSTQQKPWKKGEELRDVQKADEIVEEHREDRIDIQNQSQ